MLSLLSAAVSIFMLAALVYAIASLCGVRVPYLSEWFGR